MFNPDEQKFEVKPPRVSDRPARRVPKQISEQTPSPWLASTSSDPSGSRSSVRKKVDRIVGIILPLLGILALIGIGLLIASFISGVYRS